MPFLLSLTVAILFFLQTPTSAQNNVDHEVKGTDGKDRGATKKSKGTSGSKVGESGKVASGSGNDGGSQRCASLMMFQPFF